MIPKTSAEILRTIMSAGIQVARTTLPEEPERTYFYISGATGELARLISARVTVTTWGNGYLTSRAVVPEGGGLWIEGDLVDRIQLDVIAGSGLWKFVGGPLTNGTIEWDSEVMTPIPPDRSA